MMRSRASVRQTASRMRTLTTRATTPPRMLPPSILRTMRRARSRRRSPLPTQRMRRTPTESTTAPTELDRAWHPPAC
eukprot:1448142-Alexandrium_andersonii.AAC.1